ncbi:MAG: hypothetical protein QXS96_07370, partial [Candidatus Caldarchaeum sp.]
MLLTSFSKASFSTSMSSMLSSPTKTLKLFTRLPELLEKFCKDSTTPTATVYSCTGPNAPCPYITL